MEEGQKKKFRQFNYFQGIIIKSPVQLDIAYAGDTGDSNPQNRQFEGLTVKSVIGPNLN